MASAPTQDFRPASDQALLEAIRDRQPLALAEAYHRLVPAAHAVARRLMSGAAEVESVLMEVFARLWAEPPSTVALEGWVRRTTWAAGAERLRAEGIAPASPSASGLLPDLPAPEVRFLDAAERAIADLPDDERRALLLAHDKGVPSGSQESGAGDALVRALLTLAGPETSAGDRAALHEDGCADQQAMGDWCLGIAETADAESVEQAIEARAGCAAKSRAVRRGRRRIEGLPATPDMGQRVLVRVLTDAGAVTRATSTSAEAATAGETPPEAAPDDITAPAAAGIASLSEADDSAAAAAADPFADLEDRDAAEDVTAVDDGPVADESAAPDGPVVAEAADPHVDTADLPAASAGAAAGGAESPQPDPPEAPGESPAEAPTDGQPIADEAAEVIEPGRAPVQAGHEEWAPTPGDTAELRLSDILAEDEDPDDPFADLDAPDEEPAAAPGSGSPYAALQDLDGEPAAAPRSDAPFSDRGPAAAPGREVYVEGMDDLGGDLGPEVRRRNPVAALLSWLLPILGGAAVGILIAVQVFGAPSGV